MPSRTEPKATSSPPSSAILEQTLRGHQGIVTSIAFNPANLNGRLNSDVSPGKNDSDECSIGVGNDIASLHNEERCQHHSTRQPHQQIASSAYDGTIMVWNMHGRLNYGVDGKPGHRMNDERVRAYR